MALTTDRHTAEREFKSLDLPVAAATTIYQGAMVAINTSGDLVPAGATSTLRIVGRAAEHVVNAGAAGAKRCQVETGTFRWENSAGDAITMAGHFGALAYAVDDETVAATDDSGARPAAGVVVDVDDRGVWVAHHPLTYAI